MTEVVIAGAVRTPVGAFNGGLNTVHASYLGTVADKEALRTAKVEAGEVDEVVMGQMLNAGTGRNRERKAQEPDGPPIQETPHQVTKRLVTDESRTTDTAKSGQY